MVDNASSEQFRPVQQPHRPQVSGLTPIPRENQSAIKNEGTESAEERLIKNLFKWSFYYSQGNPIMQKDIFRVLTHYHPGLAPTLLGLPEVAKTTAQYVAAIAKPDAGLHDETIVAPAKDARDRQDTMKIIMERPAAGDKESDLLGFLSDWVGRDLEYVTHEGRPHRNVLRSDIYSSQFFNVFFLGEEPKPGYEHLMEDVKALVHHFVSMDAQAFSRLPGREQGRVRDLLYRIDALRRAYNRHSTANAAWEETFRKEKGADARVHEPIIFPEQWEKGMQELGIVRKP